jgi:hypothetical protein
MVKRYRFVSIIICLLALTPVTARSAQNMSYSFGSGETLDWSVITNTGTCGPYGGTYTEWTFSGFTYVDAWGDVYPLTPAGAAIYFGGSGLPYCPGVGPLASPLPLYMGSTLVINFYMQSGGYGSATAVNLPVAGYVNPKYAVVSLMYAPPGPASSASYANNTVVGSTTSTTSSISNQSSTSSSYIFGFEGGTKYTVNYSTSYTQATSSSSSVAVSQTSSNGTGITGCGVGLNHLCDQFRVWLNPLLIYGVAPNTSAADWFGYGMNWADQQYYPDMEIVQVSMGALEGASGFPMPSGYAGEFQRTWAINNVDGSAPGLTQADFNNIVAGNPFSNPNYTLSFTPPSITTNDGRYTATAPNEVTGSQNCGQATVSYAPNTLFSCSIGYTTTATSSENATQTYTTAYGIESEFSATAWDITFGSDTKNSTTITQTTQFNQSTNNSKGQTATLNVIGYPNGTNYSGPNEFTLWQDNLYGTFMLYP